MLEIISIGFILGITTALVPGPVIFLILTETLRGGARSGLSIVLGPFTADALVMIPAALLFQSLLTSRLTQFVIAMIGGVFLGYLGIKTILDAPKEITLPGEGQTHSFFYSYQKGFLTQILSPFAYLYWVTVGSMFIREAMIERGLGYALLFPISFWVGVSVIELFLILATSKGKKILGSIAYTWALRTCGALLVGFGLYMVVKVSVGI